MDTVLVIDMPESCSKCKFVYEFYGVKKCQLLNILENGEKAITPIKKLTTERKDCCPLKPMLEADEIRNKAIEEFAEAIKSSQNVYTWCCTDSPMEFCGGNGCEMCVLRFKKEIDEIAESMKGE